jgi:hypothetical protein
MTYKLLLFEKNLSEIKQFSWTDIFRLVWPAGPPVEQRRASSSYQQ